MLLFVVCFGTWQQLSKADLPAHGRTGDMSIVPFRHCLSLPFLHHLFIITVCVFAPMQYRCSSTINLQSWTQSLLFSSESLSSFRTPHPSGVLLQQRVRFSAEATHLPLQKNKIYPHNSFPQLSSAPSSFFCASFQNIPASDVCWWRAHFNCASYFSAVGRLNGFRGITCIARTCSWHELPAKVANWFGGINALLNSVFCCVHDHLSQLKRAGCKCIALLFFSIC